MAERPRYSQLPGGFAWDLLDPALGSLELLTPERVAAAAALVRSGRRFSLNLPLDVPDPPMFGRQAMRHEVFELLPGMVLDDKIDNFYPQASTQWDAFSHYAHTERGYFGGVDNETAKGLFPDGWDEQKPYLRVVKQPGK